MHSSTTSLLDSPELQKLGLIVKDGHVSIHQTRYRGRLYALTIQHGGGGRKEPLSSSSSEISSGDVVDRQEEFEIVRRLDHPNILKCYEISSRNDGDVHVLSEFFAAESLLGSRVPDEPSLSNLTRQILQALSYLHRRDLTHGGITPARFFIDGETGRVKIAYLGRVLTSVGGFRGDLWSLGRSILELYLGSSTVLLGGANNNNINPCFKQNSPELVPSTASDEFKDFISCCLRNDNSGEIYLTAERLLQHPFILRNSINGVHLQGHSLREKPGVQLPFTSSSTFSSSSSSMRLSTNETKLSESETQLAPDQPEHCSNGGKNVRQVCDGKQSIQIQGFKRSILENSFLVQRCAKRKKLKANLSDVSKELSVVKKNDSFSSTEDKMSSYFSTESEDSESRQEKRLTTLHAADFEFPSVPEHAKSCLLFCSLFPLDYQFDKETLVQLWIAEGLIGMEVTARMEDEGRACFDVLANEEFIVPSSYDFLHRQQKYKLNESKASYWYTKGGLPSRGYQRIHDRINDISDRSVHLSLDMEEIDSSTFETLENHKHLRTLLFFSENGSSVKQIPRSLFLSLKNLCTLDLSRTRISELPSTVGCLESLHYLNLSYTPVKLLPESIDSLHSLQTLKLRSCFALRALPEGTSNLINLRHLDLDIVRQLKSMPKRMGNLRNLHTLKAFIVGKDNGCCIGELKNLNQISGSLCISRLENVGKLEEAIEASLSTKRYLQKLELRWGGDADDAAASDELPPEEEILENLQPHYGLKELQIQFYKGSMFPSWIGNPSFDSIVSITIYKCTECQLLPSLGNLPTLKFLKMNGLNRVKDLTGLFGQNHATHEVHCAFPKLENLTLENMPRLRELTGAENGDFPCLLNVVIRYCPELVDLTVLSHLKTLKNLDISHCKKLQSLPEAGLPPSIESLRIRGCPAIRERYQENAGNDWSKIAHIPRIWIDYEEFSCD